MLCYISFTVGSVLGSKGRWYCVLPRVGGGWNYFECHHDINGRYFDPSIIDKKYLSAIQSKQLVKERFVSAIIKWSLFFCSYISSVSVCKRIIQNTALTLWSHEEQCERLPNMFAFAHIGNSICNLTGYFWHLQQINDSSVYFRSQL